MHCHVIGNGKDITRINEDVYFDASDNQHWFTWLLAHIVENDLLNLGAQPTDDLISADHYLDLVCRLLTTAKEIDAIVLLALDAVYDNGSLNKAKTDLWVSNRCLSDKVKKLNMGLREKGSDKRFFYGASVSPNRPEEEWQTELDFVFADEDAVLMKWIPSTQHIKVNEVSPLFYQRLATSGLPLLCHVGPEYSFPEGIRNMDYDNFDFLKTPLEHNVKVIAAHCASPVFPIKDPNRMKQFRALMDQANAGDEVRLWADTSALSLSTRLPVISEILELFPAKWLVHGTDFPIPIDGLPHLPFVTHGITPAEYAAIIKTKNPFDRDVKIKRAHGFDDSILTNASKVLRLP